MIGNTSFSHMSYSIAKSVFYFIQTEMYGQAGSGFSLHACVNLILFTHKHYIIHSTHAYMYRCVHIYIYHMDQGHGSNLVFPAQIMGSGACATDNESVSGLRTPI